MNPDHRAIVAQIRSAPAVLAAAVAAVPPGQHDRPPRAGEWSARETLIHVRNVLVMVYGLRIRRLLYEREPVFADYDEAAFRQEDLARREPVEDLVHPELGPMSIASLASQVGPHTEEHAGQIRDIARAH
jgi:hypothetical protein